MKGLKRDQFAEENARSNEQKLIRFNIREGVSKLGSKSKYIQATFFQFDSSKTRNCKIWPKGGTKGDTAIELRSKSDYF